MYIDVLLWLAEMLSFNHTSLIQNWTQKASFVPTSLLKQSDVKWLAHTHKLRQNCSQHHCLFCCSVAGTEYRHSCCCLQPTTEQFACLTLSDDIVKHCCLTAGHTELHLGDERPPLRYLLSLHREGRPMIMTPFVK